MGIVNILNQVWEKIWEGRKWTKGEIVYTSGKETYKCELLQCYKEVESKKWKFQEIERGSKFYFHTLIKEYQIPAQMLCTLQKWGFFNPVTVGPFIAAIPKNLFRDLFMPLYLRL